MIVSIKLPCPSVDLPVFVSKPHFLDADKSYLDGVNGLHPNRSLHDAFLEVEPVSLILIPKHLTVNTIS